MEEFSSILFRIRKELDLTQEEIASKLGVTGNYVSLLEGGKKEASDALKARLQALSTQVQEAAVENGKQRRIPLLGWAHAGSAGVYEETPFSWQKTIPTDCRDPKAFGLVLEGDSMIGQKGLSLHHGDVLVVQPSEQPYSGCIVVARFNNDGVICRQLEMNGSRLILAPLNERYPVSEHAPEEFAWIYPVFGSWTQLWNR
ncbi:helix-turn-helix domain-containing protein [Luteolibacter sp. SL250]|uniref:LexA family protein n=1 Tax=Luteolibacter sp. SL250 TaxID=2995170 RepID=UPI00227052AA|nr:S24 family peptidase [Luteolibacter sp. SL250]WAC21001.1 helix-turn-helix domain-containing protein [Luteolibacter sp. SL250]